MMSLPSSSSSISRKKYKYDVFLSFRGEDTRKNFTDHLYGALERSGIVTFRDDPKLETGEEIGPQLIKAIQQSCCFVIVFSEDYASSSWCLEELAEIVKLNKEQELKLFPIFYKVNPTDLRRQTGKVGEAFAKHEGRCKDDKDKDKVRKWRNALTEGANTSGWSLNDEYESEFIGKIVKKVSAKLRQTYPIVHDKLFGISSRLEELKSKIEITKDHDVRIIAICGMGGIGKTTLARAVYNEIAPDFEGKSFIADVREVSDKFGLVSLQKQLLSQILFDESFSFFNVDEGKTVISHRLSHKKVLVVLDDVDNLQHLECLVGKRDWFGVGSRIILTTRDEHLFRSYPVDDVYKPKTLDDDDALQLFNSKAFAVPNYDFIHLSNRVVDYAGGLPLALEVLGSFLCGRDEAQWRSAIERLARDSNKDIVDRLRISFDGLEEGEKNIFLDIACFFNGEEKDFVMKVLDGCEFFPDIGIDVLIKKSLITVDKDNRLRMHDLLKEMGRKIVSDKSSKEPGRRCRLWEERDVHHVLKKNTGTEMIEGVIIDNQRESNKILNLNGDAFLKMENLRLLKVLCLLNCEHLDYLSNELRILDWKGCPLRSFPSSFQPEKLVALLLPYSRIEQLWEGTIPLNNLKLINLEGSRNLIKTPDFTMATDLEILILEGCTRLVDVHPSIGVLKKLKLLNLKGCKSLRSLPTKIGMESLERLILSGCSNLERFPEIDGKLDRLLELNLSGCYKIENLPEGLQQAELLEELDLSKTAITIPHSFISQMKNLRELNFSGRKAPSSNLWQKMASVFSGRTNPMPLVLPSFSSSSSLTELNLRDCNLGEGDLPSDISCLSSLKFLDLSGNNFISIPSSFAQLSKLDYLGLSDCRELKSLPELLSAIGTVYTDGCVSLELIANPSKVCYSGGWASFYGLHCYRLAEKMNALTLLKKHLKVFANSRKVFSMILPGSEIPEWFTHQGVGSSITIRMPPNNDTEWMGVALCCIFVNRDASSVREKLTCRTEINRTNSGQAGFGDASAFQGRYPRNFDRRGFVFIENDHQPIINDHIFLHYLSCDMLYYPYSLEEIDNLSTSDCSNQEYDELELILETGEGRVKVKQCGVRIVYRQDLEDIQPIEEHYNSQGSAEFEDINS